jgi:hypothetical protein
VNKLKSVDIALAVANHFSYLRNIIVPNISHSLFPCQEVDVLVVMPSRWAIEVEIKVSFSDIKADLHKRHSHWNKLIRQTYFAIPRELAVREEVLEAIPSMFGVLSVDDTSHITCIRAAALNKQAVKLTEEQVRTVMRMATLRVWSLTSKNRRLKALLDEKGKTNEKVN